MYINTCTNTYINVDNDIHIYFFMYTNTDTSGRCQIHMLSCSKYSLAYSLYVCTCMYLYNMDMNTYVHTYMYIHTEKEILNIRMSHVAHRKEPCHTF